MNPSDQPPPATGDSDVSPPPPVIGSSPEITGSSDSPPAVTGISQQVTGSPAAAEVTSPERTGSPDSSAAVAGSSPDPTPDSSTAATPVKGFGLKKWRRIRRGESGSDPAGVLGSDQILKRRLSLPDPVKFRADRAEFEIPIPISASASVASDVAVVTGPLDPDLVTGFSVGADSDNSEDRSSKSTAASAPRIRQEFSGSKSRGRGFSGRGSGHAVQQRSQRGRGTGTGTDTSKKLRGDQFSKVNENENSQSSLESDLRSSFVRWGSNGKQSEVSVNDDGEHSDDGQTCEESKLGYYKENGRGGSREEFEGGEQEEENGRKGGNGRHRTDLDPFLESIVLLQAAQEALETEIQKFGGIGKEGTLADTNGLLEGVEGNNSLGIEDHFLELNQKIKHLELRLEDASTTIKAKESRVLELESTLNKTHSLKEETGSLGVPSPDGKEMELELEGLVKKRIEAEVEYLVTSSATQNWKVQTEDQIALFEEQKSLVKDQTQMMLKLKDAEKKAAMLKEHAEELETCCKELIGSEETLKLQSKICRSSLRCFTQLVMLSVALWWFLMQLCKQLPSEPFVPT